MPDDLDSSKHHPESEVSAQHLLEMLEEIAEAEGLLEGEDETSRSIIIRHLQRQLFSGPIPSPESLKGYAEIFGDRGDRIMRMSEEEQKQRHHVQNTELELSRIDLEKDIPTIQNDIMLSKRGQMMGFILFLILIGVGTLMILLNRPIGVLALIFGSATPIIQYFIAYNQKRNPRSTKDKEVNN